jgi:hypothetical protein
MKRDKLPPIVAQIIGLTMAVFFVVFWAVTGRFEPILLGFAGTVYSLGWIGSERRKLKEGEDEE